MEIAFRGSRMERMKYDGIATAMATITTTVWGGEVELGWTMGGFKKNRVRVFEGQGQGQAWQGRILESELVAYHSGM